VSSVCVGNDVVDLENPRTDGRATDERFVGRVLDEDEQETVRLSAEPDLELWCHWAAKEAGFKIISKLIGAPPPFVHRAFKVTWDGPPGSAAVEPGAVVRRGAVTYGEHRACVSVATHPGALHAVGYAPRNPSGREPVVHPRVALLDAPGSSWEAALEDLLPRFTAREADAVYSRASAAVRLGARADLASRIEVREDRLEIVCAPGPTSQRPPRVLLDGEETEADVSLSHDGRLIAWALWTGIDPIERKEAG